MGKTAVTQGNGVRAEGSDGQLFGKRPGNLPEGIQRIFIVGAGGFGREMLQWVRDTWPSHSAKLAGFLAADAESISSYSCSLPILEDPATFEPRPTDALLLAIGIPGIRRRVAEQLKTRGAEFLTLIHPTAVVSPTADVGPGSILCPYSIASDSARLGRFTLMNYHSSLGHDASTGDFSVLSPYAALGGGAVIEDDVFLGMHASVGPRVRVGPRSKVSANSAALRDTPADALVHGVPGLISPLCVVS
jgi:sugar O-acyltransferase (sialic acid O-acetyltransferase NeuD family)